MTTQFIDKSSDNFLFTVRRDREESDGAVSLRPDPVALQPPQKPSPFAAFRKLKQIKLEAAEEFGINVSDITGPSRDSRIVRARWKAMARAYVELGWGISRIGRAFDKDHTTALHAVRAMGVWKPVYIRKNAP